MIPLRVALSGFLSYRDKQEFVFDGAPLWVIVGPNGAGKSAIFDAILFALYGAHRGGHENHRALINHQCDSLQVEFDFALGSHVYRAQRTVSKKGKSSIGIFDLSISPERAVGETDREAAFKKWIADEIGLDEKTFTASVLLQQGKTEALLNADPKARHQILSQLVDISSYARLAEKAEVRQKQFAVQADEHEKALSRLARVEPQEIDELEDVIEEVEERLKNLRGRLEDLAGLIVHAAHWETLQAEKEDVEQTLDQAQELYARAEYIERDATRWDELNYVVPRLEKIFKTRKHLDQAHTQARAYERAAEQANDELSIANGELAQARTNFDILSQQRQDLQELIDAAQKVLLALGGDVHNLEELETKQDEVATIQIELKKYPSTLDDEHATLQEEINALDEMRVALPHLRGFAKARTTWNVADEKLMPARKAMDHLEQDFSRVTEEKIYWETQLIGLAAKTAEWNDKRIAARTRQNDAHSAMERFGQIEQAATCHYCGQPLDAKHLLQERERLNQASSEAEQEVKYAQEMHQIAFAQENACMQEIQARADALKKIEKEIGETNRTLENIQADMQRAKDGAESAVRSLPDDALAAFPFFDGDITILFQQVYPSDSQMMEWESHVKQYPTHKKQVEALENQIRERGKLEVRRELTQRRITELEKAYPTQRVADIRGQSQKANDNLKAGNDGLKNLQGPLRAASTTRGICETRVTNLEKQERDALRNAHGEQERGQELERTLATQLDDVTSEWRITAQEIGEPELLQLHTERQELEITTVERESLRSARQSQEERKRRLLTIEQELAGLPDEAKYSRAELDAKIRSAREEAGRIEKQRDETRLKKQELENRRDQCADLDAKREAAAKQAHLYKELARLLGREHLQRYLLQEAEKEIVKHANQILDRLSSGTLHLELRPQTMLRSKAKTTGRGVKALELLAYNSATGLSAQPVDFLSGSQRFRAAVSLALGIGQWSRNGSRAHDAVIIDEGFGSLDKQGRREMIEQLHALTGVLGRIILVSHQEEFAGAFVNRYFVELRNETSYVHLDEED